MKIQIKIVFMLFMILIWNQNTLILYPNLNINLNIADWSTYMVQYLSHSLLFHNRSPRDDVTSHLRGVDNMPQKVTYIRLHHHQNGPKCNPFLHILELIN